MAIVPPFLQVLRKLHSEKLRSHVAEPFAVALHDRTRKVISLLLSVSLLTREILLSEVLFEKWELDHSNWGFFHSYGVDVFILSVL